MSRKRILVEGWRFSPTSLAVLNMYQLLSMLDHPEIELYHRDVPFWNARFTHTFGLWPEADEARIRAIPEPPAGMEFDATLRIQFPLNLAPDPRSKRTFVLTLAEYGIIEDIKCGGKVATQELARRDITFITNSEFSREGFLRTNAAPDNVHVVHLGIDPRIMKPIDDQARESLRASLGWQGRFVFLNVSTMTMNKGITPLLAGFAMIAPRFPQAALALKGDTKLNASNEGIQAALQQLPPQLVNNLAGRISYLGDQLSFGQVAAMYQAADCYAAPYHAEGFNLPVLEAAACGTPSVCTAGGPTDEFTTEEFCKRIPSRFHTNPELERMLGKGARLLVPDVEKFAELMAQVITDDAWRARARAAGPAFAHSRFTWKHTTDRLLEVLGV